MPIDFEHTYRFTEKQFVEVEGKSSQPRRWIQMLAAGLIGVACLFWSYTMLLGLCILAVAVCMRLLDGFYARHTYRRALHLGEATTYGINDMGLRLAAPSVEARVPWESVYLWDERGNWLRLYAYGVPTFWFQIRKLQDDGVYDAVMERVRHYAVRFGSQEASRLSWQGARKRKSP